MYAEGFPSFHRPFLCLTKSEFLNMIYCTDLWSMLFSNSNRVVIKCTNQHKPAQTSTNRHKPTQTDTNQHKPSIPDPTRPKWLVLVWFLAFTKIIHSATNTVRAQTSPQAQTRLKPPGSRPNSNMSNFGMSTIYPRPNQTDLTGLRLVCVRVENYLQRY